MELLALFSEARPEIGLSEIQRLTGRDKATVYRHLTALDAAGLLEQDAASRRYRIGPAVLRLAALRERTVPRKAAAQVAADRMVAATGETAHVSLLDKGRLLALAHRETRAHSTRVVMNEDELPLHATASGLAVLAFAGPDLMAATAGSLTTYTPRTPTDPATLAARVAEARQSGFGESCDTYEPGVHSLAAPVFDRSGRVAGAVSVAAVSGRMSPALAETIRPALVEAARAVTAGWGGVLPHGMAALWARSLGETPPATPGPAPRQMEQRT